MNNENGTSKLRIKPGHNFKHKSSATSSEESYDTEDDENSQKGLDYLKKCTADKLPVNDFMNLATLDGPEIPDNILFPEELNRYLRTEIRALTSENGRLQRALEEKEEELHQSIQHNDELTNSSSSPFYGLGRASELAASKIVELSKRVRELTAECESSKTRFRSAEKRLKLFEDGQGDVTTPDVPADEREIDVDQLKVLGEKLNLTMTKLCDSRNQSQQLKQELKLLNKALASEVGENVTLQTITNKNSGWRGRAQQILALQKKVSDLQSVIREQNGEEKQEVENSGQCAMRQIEKDRRNMNEQTVRDLQEAKQQLEDTKQKLEASKTRCKILEGEMSTQKKKLNKLLENSAHDNQLIKAITSELEVLEKKYTEKEIDYKRLTSQWEEKRQCLNEIITKERSKNDQLQSLLTEKETRISKLELLEHQHQWRTNKDYNEADSYRQDSTSIESKSQTNLRLYDGCHESGEGLLVVQAAEAERLRLLELVSVLNRRLDEQRNQAEGNETNLRKERARCARLETKIGRLELEKLHGTMSRSGGYLAARKQVDKEIPDEVKYKLELMKEELLALKTRLKCLEQEKEDDLKAYAASLEETRKTFLDTTKTNSLSQRLNLSSSMSGARSSNSSLVNH